MDIKSHLKRLYDNRLLENENEIRDFNESLMEVIEYNDVSVITDLCLVLDDETEQFEVMFGLIHGIESLYKNNIEEGLVCIAKA
ncbi:Imm30 family immunity protein, partial [Bacillus pacificus]